MMMAISKLVAGLMLRIVLIGAVLQVAALICSECL